MSVKDTIKKMFTYSDDELEEEDVTEEEDADIPASKYENSKATDPGRTPNIVMFEPRSFTDVPTIANHLLKKQAAVVNMRKLSQEYKQRTIDFLYGVTYGLRGTTRQIDTESILCTPANIAVGGELT